MIGSAARWGKRRCAPTERCAVGAAPGRCSTALGRITSAAAPARRGVPCKGPLAHATRKRHQRVATLPLLLPPRARGNKKGNREQAQSQIACRTTATLSAGQLASYETPRECWLPCTTSARMLPAGRAASRQGLYRRHRPSAAAAPASRRSALLMAQPARCMASLGMPSARACSQRPRPSAPPLHRPVLAPPQLLQPAWHQKHRAASLSADPADGALAVHWPLLLIARPALTAAPWHLLPCLIPPLVLRLCSSLLKTRA